MPRSFSRFVLASELETAPAIRSLPEVLPFVIAFCGVLGLLIGSFLNVVIWRVPRGESVVSPPSHCPGCDAPDWNGELKPGPLEIGFDYCFLLPTTNDRVPQVYVENHRVRGLDPADPLWVGNEKPSEDHPTGITHRHLLRMDWSHGHNNTIHNGIGRIGFYTGGTKARFRDEDLADQWIKQSVRWIEENKSRPFFLFFASHDIHVPRMPHERFQGQTTLGFRGDAILEFDWSVGELIKTLDRLGLAEKTLVVLCSDNGPVLDDGYADRAEELKGSHRAAGPLRGGKYSLFDGGTRVPLVVSWPGRVTPGESEALVCQVDFQASFAALTGQKLEDGEACPFDDVRPGHEHRARSLAWIISCVRRSSSRASALYRTKAAASANAPVR